MPKVNYEQILLDLLDFESNYVDSSMTLIAGADEVGRGPLAGPVVACCAIMDRDDLIVGIRDSKKVSEKKRNELFPIIEEKAISIGLGVIDEKTIDEINILNATRLAFEKSIENLTVKPDFLFLDQINGVNVNYPHAIITKGDALSYAIGCASIYAKVYRDNYMIEMDKVYPEYGFAKNKGYGTKDHIEAIKKYGPCPLHRKSFIKKFI